MLGPAADAAAAGYADTADAAACAPRAKLGLWQSQSAEASPAPQAESDAATTAVAAAAATSKPRSGRDGTHLLYRVISRRLPTAHAAEADDEAAAAQGEAPGLEEAGS